MWAKALVFLPLFFLSGCESDLLPRDDLQLAADAYEERNLALCERLLERYLLEGSDPQKRWEAWQLLLKVINAGSPEPRASLECLEAMLVEYGEDGARLAEIFRQMGKYNEISHAYDKAVNAWSAYVELGDISEKERVEGFRKLAAAQFRQRHFDAGEETLRQCLALPLADNDKVYCMLDLADVSVMRDHWREAADLCRQILDSHPDDRVAGLAGYLLGDSLEQLNQPEKALEQFEASKDFYPNPDVMANRIAHLKKKLTAKK